jgi:hypothetical protein
MELVRHVLLLAVMKNFNLMRPTQVTLPATAQHKSAAGAFRYLFRHPVDSLLKKWNWKSAILSSLLRAFIFFAANLSAGLPAALAALYTELAFRGVTSGFYGAITEAFCDVEPAWAAGITVMILLPILNHSVELLVHWLRGTHNLATSILASVCFTAFSTLFNLYAMRRGALIVGKGSRSLARDLLRLPRLILDFVLLVPRAITRVSILVFRPSPRDEH